MKFRDTKTGKLFYGVVSMWVHFCEGRGLDGCCASCPIFKRMTESGSNGCWVWCEAHPREAARLMGYEIIEDDLSTEKPNKSTEDHNKTSEISTENVKPNENDGVKVVRAETATTTKPLTDWTLGEVKAYCKGRECDGKCPFYVGTEDGTAMCKVREDAPALWDLTVKPKWTQQEIADAKNILCLLKSVRSVERDANGRLFVLFGIANRTELAEDHFPSLAPGQTVAIDEIIGGGT